METNQQIAEYVEVNGLRMYYEVYGSGKPLVLLHGGGSTIDSNFGRIIPELALSRQVIAMELQAHGRTRDIDRPLSFEQDADDVAALMEQLSIAEADFFGFSNGGTTCLQIAIRYPQLVRRLVLASATFSRAGLMLGMLEGLRQASLDDMPPPLRQAYLEVTPDPEGLQVMFERDKTRMLNFKDIPEELISSVQAPALVINGDSEVILAEHALALSRLLPHGHLAILPGGHGDYIGEICAPDLNSRLPRLVVGMIAEFLDRQEG